uniref:Uncharacterized protein n=1 Tax=Pipistrellus kuhlii TaxID=59472 RepID=A0A7J7XVB0_PIPKU|nr:hypothetical protein mPipKuh1_010508 [Pipistrellus kuhlii]
MACAGGGLTGHQAPGSWGRLVGREDCAHWCVGCWVQHGRQRTPSQPCYSVCRSGPPVTWEVVRNARPPAPYDFTLVRSLMNKMSHKPRRDSPVGGEQADSRWGLDGGVEGLRKKGKKEKLMDTDHSVGWRGGGAGGGYGGGINGDGRRHGVGGEHTIVYSGVLWNCACVTCIILFTSVTPVHHSIKKERSTGLRPYQRTRKCVSKAPKRLPCAVQF